MILIEIIIPYPDTYRDGGTPDYGYSRMNFAAMLAWIAFLQETFVRTNTSFQDILN